MIGDTVKALIDLAIDQRAVIACYKAKQDQVRKRQDALQASSP